MITESSTYSPGADCSGDLPGYVRSFVPREHNFPGPIIQRAHTLVKNIQAERREVFQSIGVNGDFYNVFRQFLYGIDQLVCRRGVEVAHQFQAEARAFLSTDISKFAAISHPFSYSI